MSHSETQYSAQNIRSALYVQVRVLAAKKKKKNAPNEASETGLSL